MNLLKKRISGLFKSSEDLGLIEVNHKIFIALKPLEELPPYVHLFNLSEQDFPSSP